MAQFLALIPMTAGNFDSESATDGHVLTADGSGGAAWEEGGGGGGASFAWDGVTFTPGEFVEDSGARDIEIEFTLGESAITSGIVTGLSFMTSDANLDVNTNPRNLVDYYSDINTFSRWTSTDGQGLLMVACPAAEGHCVFTLSLANSEVAAVSVFINFMLPSGGVVTSAEFSVPGIGE